LKDVIAVPRDGSMILSDVRGPTLCNATAGDYH
jgi:hypothetical protein